MVAATVPDLDGLGIVISERYYAWYHHVLGHNLTFAVIVSFILTIFSTHRLRAFLAYFALFHLHLLMDYYGSGPEWGISYWWPWRHGPGYWWMNPHPWEFYSWQNILAASLFLLWTVWIARRKQRTPLEYLMPNLDRQLVQMGRKPAPMPVS